MITALLLAASVPVDTQQIQRQLDFIVSMCRADKVVRFMSHGGNKVSFVMVKTGELLTVKDNAAFQCALAKVKDRKDLHLVAPKDVGQ